MKNKSQTEFRVEKVIKKEGEKIYFSSKGYDNSCNRLVNEKYIV